MLRDLQFVAHRGYAASYPENTELALTAAVAAGARYIEFDIQLTRDGVPVLLHDADFFRTGEVAKNILSMDYSELADISVGEPARFGDRFGKVPVCSLQRIAELMSDWPQVIAFVELKRQSLSHFGVAAVFDAVMPVLEPVLKQCIIISFVEEALHESRRRRPRVPVGWAVRNWDERSRQRAEEFAPEYLFCNFEKLPGRPTPLWKGSWQWVIYEVTDPEVALDLYARDVRMLETMEFPELSAALSKRGENY